MPRHVALLRAVNVGGPSRQLPMADLRRIVTSLGHTDVATYIQSGNVVLTSDEADPVVVAAGIEHALLSELGLPCPTVAMDRDGLAAVVEANPYARVTEPKQLHVVFRAAPLTAQERDAVAAAEQRARDKGCPDELTVAGRVTYLHLPGGIGRSELAKQLARIPQRGAPDGGGTARNWVTVRKLLAMLDAV